MVNENDNDTGVAPQFATETALPSKLREVGTLSGVQAICFKNAILSDLITLDATECEKKVGLLEQVLITHSHEDTNTGGSHSDSTSPRGGNSPNAPNPTVHTIMDTQQETGVLIETTVNENEIVNETEVAFESEISNVRLRKNFRRLSAFKDHVAAASAPLSEDNTKAVFLTYLTDFARDRAEEFSEGNGEATFAQVVEELKSTFENPNRSEMERQLLKQCVHGQAESVDDYCARVRKLARSAYARKPRDYISDKAKEAMMDGLSDEWTYLLIIDWPSAPFSIFKGTQTTETTNCFMVRTHVATRFGKDVPESPAGSMDGCRYSDGFCTTRDGGAFAWDPTPSAQCLGSAEIARRLQISSSTVRILRRHFAGGPFILQQDWAPSHGSRSTLAVLEAHFPGFLDKNLWPASSPDLNPMDFSVWGMLEGKIAGKVFATVDDLKAALEVAWASIDDGYLRRTVNSVKKRLRACVKARGSNFEILL
uniref:Retrotrans_gag domain-containing protein n=1 Tax=Caenorhabditis japonica TaxID=281687 RepID=A0A8R1EPH4_CAEJA